MSLVYKRRHNLGDKPQIVPLVTVTGLGRGREEHVRLHSLRFWKYDNTGQATRRDQKMNVRQVATYAKREVTRRKGLVCRGISNEHSKSRVARYDREPLLNSFTGRT